MTDDLLLRLYHLSVSISLSSACWRWQVALSAVVSRSSHTLSSHRNNVMCVFFTARNADNRVFWLQTAPSGRWRPPAARGQWVALGRWLTSSLNKRRPVWVEGLLGASTHTPPPSPAAFHWWMTEKQQSWVWAAWLAAASFLLDFFLGLREASDSRHDERFINQHLGSTEPKAPRAPQFNASYLLL